MKIGIFDPYLDTLGGGERYILTIASCLADHNEVFLFWNDKSILRKASKKFGIEIKNIKLTENIFSSKVFFLRRILNTRKYDLIFFISDGSIPILLSKKNVLIFQFPVNWVNGKKFLTRLKLKKINKIICYSNFVKNYLDKNFLVNSLVLYPYIERIDFRYSQKENIILTVGRFTRALNRKKQEILISAFKKMHSEGLHNWRFILIGSVLQKDRKYLKKLKDMAKNYPIEILENISFKNLLSYYNKSKIYWHAAGFGENLEKHPEYAEHFGISTVEAMGAGAVPVVINAGGQKEIVEDEKNGFLWNTLGELMKKTELLIKNQDLWNRMSKEAVKRADFFAGNRFCSNLKKILEL
ncbi:MAG: glycosyltransferase family 4 protein [Candidatus Pacearchaeota archaeon]